MDNIKVLRSVDIDLEGNIQDVIDLLISIKEGHPEAYVSNEVGYGYDDTPEINSSYTYSVLETDKEANVRRVREAEQKARNDKCKMDVYLRLKAELNIKD